MGVLTKIRNRSGLVIGIVGFAIISFLVGDALNNRFSIFNQSSNAVASISGENISPKELQALVDMAENDYKIQSGQTTLEPAMQEQVKQQAWNQLIQNFVYAREYKKLGLSVTGEEIFELTTGDNPHSAIIQAFTDPRTNQFNKEAVINFLKQKDNDETGKSARQWAVFEVKLVEERLNQKYNAMIRNAIYTTKLEAEANYLNKNRTISVDFIQLPYSTVSDSLIKVTDADMADYYKSHRYKYKPVTERRAEYVVFDVTPTREDSAVIFDELVKLKEPFAKSTDDTAFVAANNDVPFDANSYVSMKEINPLYVDQYVNAGVGAVIGPFLQGNSYRLTKIVNIKNDSTVYMRASHILLPFNGPDTAAVFAKANQLKTQVQNGEDFGTLAMTNSTDGSASRGGDLGWFKDGDMVPEFNNAVKTGKKGDLKVVKTMFGIHVIKITEDKVTKQFQLAVIERPLDPQDETVKGTFNKAMQFAAESRTREAFDANREKLKMNALIADRIKEDDREVAGLDASSEMVSWMYNAKVGDVSQVMEFGNKMVVAVLTEARSKENPKWQDFKTEIEKEVRNQKKAEVLLKKLAEADGLTTLADIGKKLNVTVMEAPSLAFAFPSLPYIGEDREFAGALFGLPKGKLSKPVIGMQGVYVGTVKAVNEPAAITDVPSLQTTMSAEARSAGEFEAYNAVKTAANIQDFRYRFNMN